MRYFLERVARKLNRIVMPVDPTIDAIRPFTMLTSDRLNNLVKLAKKLIAQKIPGSFVECGTCRGGSAALLASLAKNEGWKREIFLLDSFQGHPEARGDAPDSEEVARWSGTMVASVADVKAALQVVNSFDAKMVHILPGWFQDTIPNNDFGPIALLHLDCDFYDAVKFCLEKLFDKVVTGGYIVIDDYSSHKGCKLAVDEFSKSRKDKMKYLFNISPAIVFQKG